MHKSHVLAVNPWGQLTISHSSSNAVTASEVLSKLSWHHVAVTCDEEGNAKLYVDGKKAGSGQLNMHLDKNQYGETLVLGSSGNTAHKFFGEMKYAKVHDGVLTADEIKDSYKEHTEEFDIEVELNGKWLYIHPVVQKLMTWDVASEIIDDLNDIEGFEGAKKWRFLTKEEAKHKFGKIKTIHGKTKDFKDFISGYKISGDDHFFWINEKDWTVSFGGAAFETKTAKEANLIIIRDK